MWKPLLAGACALALPLAAQASDAADVDKVFAKYGRETPGCAVSVERPGEAAIVRAYGSADLEHAVPITADTVFEAGSVSKQFTAALILLLVQDGKLSLSDDIRKYLPELPDYGAPVTIDRMLSHTSGLRDWGSVAALGGWPRGDRVHTQADTLVIAARQQALNFKPGADWSYSNTGYNLLAIVAERVGGKSFAQLSKERLFDPLGMGHTQWRDDFRRIVPGRAMAYGRAADGYRLDMPFENVVGNGGLLTTVADLAAWNRALASRRLGELVTGKLEEAATLEGGRRVGYSRGLFLAPWGKEALIYHSGSTGGYRAWLGRLPGRRISVAVLCNTGESADPLGRAVLAGFAPGAAADQPVDLNAEPDLTARAGLYVDGRWGWATRLTAKDGRLVDDAGNALSRRADGTLVLDGDPIAFRPDGGIEIAGTGAPILYTPAKDPHPTEAELDAAVGTYASGETHARYVVSLRDGALWIGVDDRPGWSSALKPVYPDAFLFDSGIVRLVRAPDGKVTGLTLSNARVWSLTAKREEFR